jgi:hypothetical protein
VADALAFTEQPRFRAFNSSSPGETAPSASASLRNAMVTVWRSVIEVGGSSMSAHLALRMPASHMTVS